MGFVVEELQLRSPSGAPSIHPADPLWLSLGTGKLVCVLGFSMDVLLR